MTAPAMSSAEATRLAGVALLAQIDVALATVAQLRTPTVGQ